VINGGGEEYPHRKYGSRACPVEFHWSKKKPYGGKNSRTGVKNAPERRVEREKKTLRNLKRGESTNCEKNLVRPEKNEV